MITTLIGSLYLTAVAISAINMENPPSPTNATHWRVAIVPLSQLTIASSRKMLSQFPGDYLRFHRFVAAGGAFLHDLPPVLHAGLRSLEKTPVFFALSSGISSRKVLRLSPTRPTSTG
jgi:hypothetical protein